MSAPRPGSSSALISCRPGPMVCTTWPVLTNIATSSAFTIACVKRRIVRSGHLKTIWPLRSSGTAMNSRENSAMGASVPARHIARHIQRSPCLNCYLPGVEAIQCGWCHAQNQPGTTSCMTCGAPLDVRDKVSDSGWREAPRLRDMTEFRFSASTCQVEGELVPVAEIALSPQDGVYFEHHVLLWKDESVPLSSLKTSGAKRTIGGMPHIVTVANGPARIAFSRDAPGELVVLPLHPGMELDVREHAFLLASHSISYSFVRIKGLANVLHGGSGMWMDRFVTAQYPGLLMLHGNGDVLERMLRPGEKILVEPGGFLYKDSSVGMNAVQMPLKTGMFGRHGMYLAEMTGPGRVGIQSMYHHHGS